VIDTVDHVKLDPLLRHPGTAALAAAVAVAFVQSIAFVCHTFV